MSWEKIKLGDISIVSSSKRIFARQYVKSGIPFYRQKEIIDKKNKNEIANPLYISQETYYDIKNKFGVPQKGDLLITAVGVTLGIPYVVNDEMFYFKDGNLIWLRDFDKNINSKYLYYWITSDVGQKSMWSRTIGSAQPALTIDMLKQFEIPVPAYERQCKIVDILSAYDDLIENNRKQIKLLKEVAERLYKEWFVYLRFPGYEDVKIIDGVPEGWNCQFLNKVVGYEIGGGWGEGSITEKCDKPAYVIRGTDLHGITNGDISGIPYRYHANKNLEARVLEDGDIIFEVSGGSKTEGVARTALIRDTIFEILRAPVMCASFCKLVRVNKKQYSQLLFDTFQYMRASGKTGEYDKKSASSIVNYRWKDFLSAEIILIPNDELLSKYNALSENIYQLILKKSIEIEKAKEARDRLLPKLMNGEVEAWD